MGTAADMSAETRRKIVEQLKAVVSEKKFINEKTRPKLGVMLFLADMTDLFFRLVTGKIIQAGIISQTELDALKKEHGAPTK